MANNLVTFVIVSVLCMFLISVVMRKKLKEVDEVEKRENTVAVLQHQGAIHKLIEEAVSKSTHKANKKEFVSKVNKPVLAYRPASHGLSVNSLCSLSDVDGPFQLV